MESWSVDDKSLGLSCEVNRAGVTGAARAKDLLEERDAREDGVGFITTCAALVYTARGVHTRRTVHLLQVSFVVLQLSSTLLL